MTQNFSLANVSKVETVGVSKMARAMIVTRATYSVPVNHQLLYVLYLRTWVIIVRILSPSFDYFLTALRLGSNSM